MKRILYIAVLAAFGASASAQTLPSLLVNTDPAAAGRAGVVLGSSAWSPQDDAAAMALSEGRFAAGASYGLWKPADKVIGFSAFYRSGRFAVGAFGKLFSYPSYRIVNGNGVGSQVTPTFTPSENSFGAAFAYSFRDGLAAGVTLRSLSSKLGEEASASVIGVDVSVKYASGPLQAVLSLHNLGGKVNYGGDDWSQPMYIRAGGAYAVLPGLTAGAQVDYLFDGALMAGVGAEYAYEEMLFVRAGFHYGDAAKAVPSYASLGVGGRYKGLSLDFAYLISSTPVGGSLTLGLGYAF